MKMVRTAPPKPQPSRPIKSWPHPAPNPPPVARPAPSNKTAADTIRKAAKPGGS
jgi:hypothetical protein